MPFDVTVASARVARGGGPGLSDRPIRGIRITNDLKAVTSSAHFKAD